MRSQRLELDTSSRWYVDLTARCREFVREEGDGLLNVFVPHATAGLAVIELGDGSEPDFHEMLERLLPRDLHYNHQHGSSGHGADHLLPALLTPSLTLPVLAGAPALGTWQHVVFVDLNADNPRREVLLTFLSD